MTREGDQPIEEVDPRLGLTPHAKASTAGTCGKVSRNTIISLLEPRTGVVDANDRELFRCDLVDVGFIRDGDTGPLDVLGIGVAPRIDCVHRTAPVGRVVCAGLAGVNGGVPFRSDGPVSEAKVRF